MASTGKGGEVKKSSAEEGLLSVATNLINQSEPLRKEVLGQTQEALTTGGIGARLPIVQKGIEASRAATSSALSQLDADSARSSLGRSGFRDQLRANTLLSGELATQAIPQDVAAQMIQVAPTLTMGFTGQGLQGYGSATGAANQRMGISAQRDIAKGNQQTQMVTSVLGAAAMAGGCWIAARLYGWHTPRFYAARHFIFDQWTRPAWLVRWVRVTYLRHGEALAQRPWAVAALRPLFAVAWRLGRRGYERSVIERRLGVRQP